MLKICDKIEPFREDSIRTFSCNQVRRPLTHMIMLKNALVLKIKLYKGSFEDGNGE